MTENVEAAARSALVIGAPSLRTPAGLHTNTELAVRRAVLSGLCAATYGLLLWAMTEVLGAGGWTTIDFFLLLCLAIASPWSILGFWNAAIGLWLLHVHKDGLEVVAPFAAAGDTKMPVAVRTAVVMTVRNEDPGRAILRLETVKESIDRTGWGAAFGYFLLSDTDDPAIAAREQASMEAWAAREGDPSRIVYRRRANNAGYKAGNVRDFCTRWGRDFELMLLLDADSLMAGPAVLRLVRIMQAHPRIGILQSLVMGLPSSSAFARIFQFGMRHGMRAFTMGHAWWSGDCGPFWGHNALVRIKPFHEFCRLPVLPGKPPLGGPVLSHDHVEAALMRRAGFEVRVLPREDGSWEENPPTLIDYAKREMRWCQGNLQYLRLMRLPGLKVMSRIQLFLAVLVFLGLPAWILMAGLLPIATWEAQAVPDYPFEIAAGLYTASLAICFAPKVAGFLDAMLTPGGVASYGGSMRFAASVAIELVFSFLQAAVSAFRTSLFMIGLLFGGSVGWTRQAREQRALGWRTALAALWPQLLFGAGAVVVLLASSPTVLLWSLPLTGSFLLAVPFAVLTARPAVGRFLKRTGLCGVPEDFRPPAEVRAVEQRSERRDEA